MKQYLDLLRDIEANGVFAIDRTQVGTKTVVGRTMRFDLTGGLFPLMTTKKLPFRVILEELLWFIRGDTKLRSLLKVNVHIWDEWPFKWYLQSEGLPIPIVNSDEWKKQLKEFTDRILTDDEFNDRWGDLGPVYGRQWRAWPCPDGTTIDQLQNVLTQIRNDPSSRRIIVCAWNPSEIKEMAKAGLPPCHCLFQFHVLGGKLTCQLYQRSCDTFLGVPFNIASYALLTMMVAHVTGLEAKEFVWDGSSVHLYQNHSDQVAEQLSREPRPLPRIKIRPEATDLFAMTAADFELIGYDPLPRIEAPIAV